ncbi:MAG: adenosine-specific kinase [Thermoplasmata archaeon]
MNIVKIYIEKEEDENVILGQTHFIKSVEDIYEALKNSSPSGKFAIAMNEASGKRLVRFEGNDEKMEQKAVRNALNVGAGHFFIIHLSGIFPINVLAQLRNVPELVNIYAATANPLYVIVAEDGDQRGVLGVMDGLTPVGVERDDDKKERIEFLKKIGYKK